MMETNFTQSLSKPQNISSYADLENACLAHMASNGIHFPGPLQETEPGKYYRFSGDSKKNQKDEFYACSKWEFKGRPYLSCYYGTWEGGKKEYTFMSFDNDPHLSKEDYQQFKADEERRKQKYEEQQKKDIEKRIQRAKNIWENSQEIPSHADHIAYLDRKQVKAVGIKYSTDFDESKNHVLVIPLRNVDGEIQAIQHIKANGEKKIHGIKRGHFHVLGEIKDDGELFCAEGYATAYSVHEAKGSPVVVAFDCGNIDPVIEILKTKYPKISIIIAADNDKTKPGNPGRTYAEKAAAKYKCSLASPEFPEGLLFSDGKTPTDFNDLRILLDVEEVINQLSIKCHSGTCIQSELDKLTCILTEKDEPCANFSTKDLPKLLREYINRICCDSDAHPIMITTSVLGSISGIIKKRMFIPKGEYFQTLYANLWILNLYKSGGFKTTAMENGANIARQISKEVLHEMKKIEEELRKGMINKEIAAQRKLEHSLKDVILPNKITAEALQEHLSVGHSGVILTGEFGAWLQNMEKMHNTDLKGIFTELYDVPPSYRSKTKTQGDHILESPYFSIYGVSTLAWLKENLKPNDVTSGFFARFLLFTPPHHECIPQALPRVKTSLDTKAELMVKKTLENMAERYEYKLAPSAKFVFESTHGALYSMSKCYSERCQEILDPYLKRWSPSILKLAMIMRLFEDPTSEEISDTAINAAMAIVLPAIKSTAQLFEGELGESEHQRKCRLILKWIHKRIQKGKDPTWAALITSEILDGGATMYEYPMKTLVEGGQINEIQKTLKTQVVP